MRYPTHVMRTEKNNVREISITLALLLDGSDFWSQLSATCKTIENKFNHQHSTCFPPISIKQNQKGMQAELKLVTISSDPLAPLRLDGSLCIFWSAHGR